MEVSVFVGLAVHLAEPALGVFGGVPVGDVGASPSIIVTGAIGVRHVTAIVAISI